METCYGFPSFFLFLHIGVRRRPLGFFPSMKIQNGTVLVVPLTRWMLADTLLRLLGFPLFLFLSLEMSSCSINTHNKIFWLKPLVRQTCCGFRNAPRNPIWSYTRVYVDKFQGNFLHATPPISGQEATYTGMLSLVDTCIRSTRRHGTDGAHTEIVVIFDQVDSRKQMETKFFCE